MQIVDLSEHPEHIPLLATWHQAEWGHLNPGSTAHARAERLRLHGAQPGIPMTFIAIEDNVLLGSASLVANDLTTHPHLSPFLASVYVAPAYRRHGIASALVRHAVLAAEQFGITTAYLITLDQQRLYARLGWTEVEQVRYRGELLTLMAVTCKTFG